MGLPFKATVDWQSRTLATDEIWKPDGGIRVDTVENGYGIAVYGDESIRFLSGSTVWFKSLTKEPVLVNFVAGI